MIDISILTPLEIITLQREILSIKVAGEWTFSGECWQRRLHDGHLAAEVQPDGIFWRWTAYCRSFFEIKYTIDEAKAAADQALILDGWVLV